MYSYPIVDVDCNDLSNIDFWKRVIRLSGVYDGTSLGTSTIVSFKKNMNKNSLTNC